MTVRVLQVVGGSKFGGAVWVSSVTSKLSRSTDAR